MGHVGVTELELTKKAVKHIYFLSSAPVVAIGLESRSRKIRDAVWSGEDGISWHCIRDPSLKIVIGGLQAPGFLSGPELPTWSRV